MNKDKNVEALKTAANQILDMSANLAQALEGLGLVTQIHKQLHGECEDTKTIDRMCLSMMAGLLEGIKLRESGKTAEELMVTCGDLSYWAQTLSDWPEVVE